MGIDLIEMYMNLEEEFDVNFQEEDEETVGDLYAKVVRALKAKGTQFDAEDVCRRILAVIVDITRDDPTKITKDTRILDLTLG